MALSQSVGATTSSVTAAELSSYSGHQHQEDVRCYNFSVGQPHRQEFYSPGYPGSYPPKIDCILVLKGMGIMSCCTFVVAGQKGNGRFTYIAKPDTAR